MKVERLSLRNFRNIRECSFEPSAGINFLVGKNGQGKTSFLEAVSFIATLRSFRGAKADEVLLWGETQAEVLGTISPRSDTRPEDNWQAELKVLFQRSSASDKRTTKTAYINGKPFRSSTQFLSHRFGNFELGFHTVIFNPADHDLVRGEPAIRRGYLDRVLAAEEIEYLKVLQKYQRTLEQRNALLKGDQIPSPSLLRGFTEPLAHLGAQLTRKRLEWLQRLSEKLPETLFQIAPQQAVMKVFYVSQWVQKNATFSNKSKDLCTIHFTGQESLPSLELLEQAFWTQVSTVGEAELRARTTLVGPHRDDWGFLFGGQVLKGHGSQGEVRSALLALKLSEIELFQNRTGHEPILLLDDFSSELDRDRRDFLLQYLKDSDLQVFVTTTEAVRYPGTHFVVTSGKINPLDRGNEEEGVYDHRID